MSQNGYGDYVSQRNTCVHDTTPKNVEEPKSAFRMWQTYPGLPFLCAPETTKTRHGTLANLPKTKKASSTLRASQAVPHPSTDRALQRLTSEFGRDPVYSLRYGR